MSDCCWALLQSACAHADGVLIVHRLRQQEDALLTAYTCFEGSTVLPVHSWERQQGTPRLMRKKLVGGSRDAAVSVVSCPKATSRCSVSNTTPESTRR